MKPLEDLSNRLKQRFPELLAKIDSPFNPESSWWLDLDLHGHSATVEWRPGLGFGVLSSDSDTYGEGPDEIYADVASALERLVVLLGKRERTVPPDETVLRNLRQSRQMSQEELAARLHVRQSAVSKLERRADVRLSTLKHFVAAMGGVLELRVKFPDAIVRLTQYDDLAVRSRPRRHAARQKSD